MHKVLFCGLLFVCITGLQAQNRILIGGMAGLSTAYISSAGNEMGFQSSSTPYAGLQLDYQLTSRLSINGQLFYQSEKYKSLITRTTFVEDVRLTAKRLITGFTEYLPTGNHAAFVNMGLTITNYNGTAIDAGLNSNANLFKRDGFKPWQFGWGIQLGYIFNFGLSLQTGYLSEFTNLYKVENTRLNRQQIQILQIGYMPSFKKRDKIDTWKRKNRKWR